MARTGAARKSEVETAGAALLSRQRALSAVAHAASVEAARAVAHAAAVAWWQASAKAHGAPRLATAALPAGLVLADLSPFTVADAAAFGRDLARLPVAMPSPRSAASTRKPCRERTAPSKASSTPRQPLPDGFSIRPSVLAMTGAPAAP